ncbi:HTH domain-containing protein [Variovorax paradoxus]|uniref:HTH domain-containing protein n=1 Tax=Variovorax paradoxus TaxID=34073 RepID=UPI003D6590D2
MRRLQAIAEIIEGRRVTTLTYLAERFEMSERHLARDIAELRRSGMRIVGGSSIGFAVERTSGGAVGVPSFSREPGRSHPDTPA